MSGTDNTVATGAITPRCHMPWQQMVIDSSGYVAPCCYWGAIDNAGGVSLGDFNTETIEQIWNGPAYRKLRAGMARGDLEAAGCGGCQAVKQGMALAFEYDPACENETGEPSVYASNIATLKREVAAGAEVLEAKPTIVSYTPSHRCNIRCTHCYQDGTRLAEISRPRADADVEALAPYLVRIVAGGGEPFLLPIWRKFLKNFDLSINRYLTFSTSTNATVVTDEVAAGLRRFKKLIINVSVDGTGDAFERVRVGAKFATVRRNVQLMKTIAASSDDPNSAVGVSMCVMKSNIHDLPNFVRFCAEDGHAFGIWPVTALPPAESLRHFDNAALEVAGWADAIDEAERLTHELYLPAMAKRRNAPGADPTEHAFWKNNFQLLRDAIPFDLPRVPARIRQVSLPTQLLRRYSELLAPNGAVEVYVFQRNSAAMPFAHAPSVGGVVSVALPPGSYCLNFPRGPDQIPDYWDVVRFDVASEDATIQATYNPFTRRRIEARLKPLGMPEWVSRFVVDRATR